MYGAAAVHQGQGILFAGLGGWGAQIDTRTTPFLRALDWTTLQDAWPTTVGTDGVRRYHIPGPPLYVNQGEEALSSPAVVNDVVFVSTNKPALYAFDVATGACLWSGDGLPSSPANGVNDAAVLGPAVSGNYVVIGCLGSVYIYAFEPSCTGPDIVGRAASLSRAFGYPSRSVRLQRRWPALKEVPVRQHRHR